MATYQFATITTTQAQSYDAATDDLQFSGLGAATALNFEVLNGTSPGAITIRYLPTGGSATLGSNATGDTLTMPDGTKLILPLQDPRSLEGTTGGDRIYGGNGRDTLSGLGGDDRLESGPLRDRLIGGAGQDTLSGGGDIDTFVFAPGDSGVEETQSDVIIGWFGDILEFAAVMPGGYAETTASSRAEALAAANQQIANGIDVVAVEVGGEVILFADTGNDNGGADSAVRLAGATLVTVDSGSIVAQAPPATPPPGTTPPTTPTTPAGNFSMPAPPSAPPRGGIVFSFGGNMDTASFGGILQGEVLENSPSAFQMQGPSSNITIRGSGFTYDEDDDFVYAITGGLVTFVNFSLGTAAGQFNTSVGIPAVTLFGWVLQNQPALAFQTVLSGNDLITGSSSVTSLLRGYAGNDMMEGRGANSLLGGLGDDVILAHSRESFGDPAVYSSYTSTVLRGEEGNDYILGAQGFDDIHGNQGADTASGREGDDWVVGGKDNDLLFGESGADLVYGNLGNDTCEGGDGGDIVRGGQNDDVINGGAGDDYVSGDKGDDTVSGGAGADLFHTFGDAGLDRVLDFSVADGDRVLLDPGTQFTVAQSGADTVISMTGGGQMILVGVQLSALPEGWIFGA